MNHQAQTYISNQILPSLHNPQEITSKYLNNPESIALSNYLKHDAISYLYSATVSIGNAIHSLERELSTWSTVKLYYTTFYALRSLLALDGICIFYVGTKPFAIKAQAGQAPCKREGNSHKVVLKEFKDKNPEHLLLSQTIEYKEPLDWLMEKRENANYKMAKFCEPHIPSHFKKIVDNGLRLSIKDYLNDSLNLYLFDPDHAMVAYPLRVIQIVYQQINTPGAFSLQEREIQYLCKLFKDKSGLIPEMQNMLKNC